MAHCQQILVVADDISVTYHLDVDTMEEYTTSHPHVVVVRTHTEFNVLKLSIYSGMLSDIQTLLFADSLKKNLMLWFDVLSLGPWKVLICTC